MNNRYTIRKKVVSTEEMKTSDYNFTDFDSALTGLSAMAIEANRAEDKATREASKDETWFRIFPTQLSEALALEADKNHPLAQDANETTSDAITEDLELPQIVREANASGS